MSRKIELVKATGPDVLLWDVAETCRQLGGMWPRLHVELASVTPSGSPE